MLYTIPDYYPSFECIADKCEDTCCAGWQIVIDKETLKKYTKVLYSQARLIEGLTLDNPTEISNLICEMMAK